VLSIATFALSLRDESLLRTSFAQLGLKVTHAKAFGTPNVLYQSWKWCISSGGSQPVKLAFGQTLLALADPLATKEIPQ
jgi:hypothetical protein